MTNVGFCPLASGSGGNSVFFSSPETNILIDAGLSGIRIQKALESIGINPGCIDAVFVTHEHRDHISGAGILSRRFGIPIYATEGTWERADRAGFIGKLQKEQRHVVNAGGELTFRDVVIRPFRISHDAASPVGYSFIHNDVKATVATDLGHVCEDALENISNSDILLIESNHDIDMLKNGSYPFYLKKRILSDKGHLSNVTCGQTLASLAAGLRHIYLGHMSEENNNPVLAFETVRGILEARSIPVNSPCGAGVSLYIANRDRVSKYIKQVIG